MTVLDPRVLHVLLARGADVHAVDGEGMSALNHHAAELQATSLLLAYGAPPNQTTPSGQTPLMVAGAWNAASRCGCCCASGRGRTPQIVRVTPRCTTRPATARATRAAWLL